jgi:N-hydroxyarylamine O-acetyltransferase
MIKTLKPLPKCDRFSIMIVIGYRFFCVHQMSDVVNLDAYFQRIGYSGDRTPTRETLRLIHQRHTETIAFENLSPFLKQPVFLDLEALQQKLIYEGRGGYCFEQNLLFRAVLIALGFRVTNLAARVLWNLPEGTLNPRSHMLLLVEVDEKTLIADVGFGGFTFTTPLHLTPNLEQQTSLEAFRLIKDDSAFIAQVNLGQAWKSLYHFDLQPQQLPDYEVSNWYISTHPNSMFTKNLILARPDLGRRYALRNNQFTIHHYDSYSEQHCLKSVKELCTILEDAFLLQLPMHLDLDSALQRLVNPIYEAV